MKYKKIIIFLVFIIFSFFINSSNIFAQPPSAAQEKEYMMILGKNVNFQKCLSLGKIDKQQKVLEGFCDYRKNDKGVVELENASPLLEDSSDYEFSVENLGEELPIGVTEEEFNNFFGDENESLKEKIRSLNFFNLNNVVIFDSNIDLKYSSYNLINTDNQEETRLSIRENNFLNGILGVESLEELDNLNDSGKEIGIIGLFGQDPSTKNGLVIHNVRGEENDSTYNNTIIIPGEGYITEDLGGQEDDGAFDNTPYKKVSEFDSYKLKNDIPITLKLSKFTSPTCQGDVLTKRYTYCKSEGEIEHLGDYSLGSLGNELDLSDEIQEENVLYILSQLGEGEKISSIPAAYILKQNGMFYVARDIDFSFNDFDRESVYRNPFVRKYFKESNILNDTKTIEFLEEDRVDKKNKLYVNFGLAPSIQVKTDKLTLEPGEETNLYFDIEYYHQGGLSNTYEAVSGGRDIKFSRGEPANGSTYLDNLMLNGLISDKLSLVDGEEIPEEMEYMNALNGLSKGDISITIEDVKTGEAKTKVLKDHSFLLKPSKICSDFSFSCNYEPSNFSILRDKYKNIQSIDIDKIKLEDIKDLFPENFDRGTRIEGESDIFPKINFKKSIETEDYDKYYYASTEEKTFLHRGGDLIKYKLKFTIPVKNTSIETVDLSDSIFKADNIFSGVTSKSLNGEYPKEMTHNGVGSYTLLQVIKHLPTIKVKDTDGTYKDVDVQEEIFTGESYINEAKFYDVEDGEGEITSFKIEDGSGTIIQNIDTSIPGTYKLYYKYRDTDNLESNQLIKTLVIKKKEISTPPSSSTPGTSPSTSRPGGSVAIIETPREDPEKTKPKSEPKTPIVNPPKEEASGGPITINENVIFDEDHCPLLDMYLEDDGSGYGFDDIYGVESGIYKDIVRFKDIGVTRGTIKPFFEPDRGIFRSEYLAMILNAHCIKIDEYPESLPFKDFKGKKALGTWEAKVVKKGLELGIINEKNEYFRKHDYITFSEAYGMVLKIRGIQLTKYKTFNRDHNFEDWQNKQKQILERMNMLKGITYQPNAIIDRKEMINTLAKFYLFYDKVRKGK